VAAADIPDGRLELRRRGDGAHLILIGGRVLMNSAARHSEEQLAVQGCRASAAAAPRVLVGGLGMGCTLRAALDTLPAGAHVTVAELNPVIVEWCRGPLATLNRNAIHDPRVVIQVGDVSQYISASKAGAIDVILLDLYAGPNEGTDRPDDPFYGRAALAQQHRALAAGGVLAVWGERRDLSYERRLAAAGFRLEGDPLAWGGDAWKHAVYVARRVTS
jgi:spermidine synthase